MKKVWLEFVIFIKSLLFFYRSKTFIFIKKSIPFLLHRRMKVKDILEPLNLLDAVNPRSDAAFYPFKNMSFAEWNLHRYYRNGSSYLARLRVSQELLRTINGGVK